MKALSEFDTLEAAKAHTETRGKMIPRVTMNSLLAQAGLFNAFEQAAANNDAIAAFMHPTSTEYNFIQSSATGQAQIGLLDALIASGQFVGLATLRPTVIALANEIYSPYANATEHDFRKAKGNCPVKAVIPVNGYLKITLTQDVEAHRPQVYVEIQGVFQRVTGFGLISKSGDYLLQVPRNHSVFYVDDPYGSIS